ncbi:hypothetical protein DFP72DRAFT_811151 [Ephemerocybe angulata]|uniref:Integrase core domain-containing protein n=1 Tax=Ephemerocybe angulata TaxID=980116 RepID=A0A8H6M5U5_9AGAR|nr:hypothetical protein DFP72DRAFT_811151 [Tulosesus angulatus]
MERVRGADRGSYIWGKSVHNIRIECLWVDVTSGFGRKWKRFFEVLEQEDNLDRNNDAHIWLLHFLYLHHINRDAAAWLDTWNHHVLSRRGTTHVTPSRLFIQGTIERGHRGLVVDDVLDDVDGYGIDWDDHDNPRYRNHHQQHNQPEEEEGRNGAPNMTPTRLSHVEVGDPRCPFTEDGVQFLDNALSALPENDLTDMGSLRLLWTKTQEIINNMH